MPTYEYTGPVPSKPIDYTLPGGGKVEGRVFTARQELIDIPGAASGVATGKTAGGEHVAAAENPDPSLFVEVSPTP